ncbi:MAG: host attachment protein [Alphaproteobacteria bacterium]
MLLPHGTVIALVDGKKLELYRNIGDATAPDLLPVEPPGLDEQNRNAGARHVSSAANPPGHQIEEDSHAAAAADWLGHQVSERQIAHLVIIAAPRTLGEMRRRYHKSLEAALIAEVHKDLNGSSAAEIVDALKAQ